MKRHFATVAVVGISLCVGIVIGVAGTLAVMFLYVGASMGSAGQNDQDNHDPRKQKEMLEVALAVGDLEPIPAEATVVSVYTRGSDFTREFHVQFKADTPIIARWLRQSRGIRNSSRETLAGGKVKYIFHSPKMNYAYGEVIVDYGKRIVVISVANS